MKNTNTKQNTNAVEIFKSLIINVNKRIIANGTEINNLINSKADKRSITILELKEVSLHNIKRKIENKLQAELNKPLTKGALIKLTRILINNVIAKSKNNFNIKKDLIKINDNINLTDIAFYKCNEIKIIKALNDMSGIINNNLRAV